MSNDALPLSGAGRCDPARHEPDLFFQREVARPAAVDASEQHRGADRRMTGEGKLARRREDAQLGAVRLVGRRKHEHGFGEIELARDRLHRGGVEPVGIEHDGERITGKAPGREHVERDEAAAHERLLRLFPPRTRGSV